MYCWCLVLQELESRTENLQEMYEDLKKEVHQKRLEVRYLLGPLFTERTSKLTSPCRLTQVCTGLSFCRVCLLSFNKRAHVILNKKSSAAEAFCLRGVNQDSSDNQDYFRVFLALMPCTEV